MFKAQAFSQGNAAARQSRYLLYMEKEWAEQDGKKSPKSPLTGRMIALSQTLLSGKEQKRTGKRGKSRATVRFAKAAVRLKKGRKRVKKKGLPCLCGKGKGNQKIGVFNKNRKRSKEFAVQKASVFPRGFFGDVTIFFFENRRILRTINKKQQDLRRFP